MNLSKIDYKTLSHKAKESYNYQKASAKLAEYGYATNWLNVDFESADFIATPFNGKDEILKIQLKGRLTIDKKYIGKDIYMCWPSEADSFYLIPHDELIEVLDKHCDWLKSDSWLVHGGYSNGKPKKEIMGALEGFIL